MLTMLLHFGSKSTKMVKAAKMCEQVVQNYDHHLKTAADCVNKIPT
jgi:hypothetical protein